MHFLPFILFTLIVGSCVHLTSGGAISLGKLAMERFVGRLDLCNAGNITENFIYSHLDDLTAEISAVLENEFGEVVASSLERYRRIIRYAMNDNGNNIKKLLESNNEISSLIDDEWRLVTYDLLSIDSNDNLDDVNEFGINNIEQNFVKYEKYLNQGAAPLIARLVRLLERKVSIQNDIIELVVTLHKLIIEDEMILTVYLFNLKQSKLDALYKRVSKLSKLLNIYKRLNMLLIGNFDKPFRISILKLMSIFDESGDNYVPDNLIKIYPYKKIINRFNSLLGKKKGETTSENNYNCYDSKSDTYIDFENRGKDVYFNVSLDKIDDFSEDTSPLEPKNDALGNSIGSLTVKENNTLFNLIGNLTNGTNQEFFSNNKSDLSLNNKRFTDCSKGVKYFEMFLSDVNENDGCEDKYKDVLKNRGKSSNHYIYKKSIPSTVNLIRQDNTITESDLKCLSTQFMCPVVRHLNEVEMHELDKTLSIFNDGPAKKDKTLVWAISESLVDNYGARVRLLKFISLKVVDVYSSIERLNQTPLMNIGDNVDEGIGFYREKQKKMLSALLALEEFLKSNSTVEIILRRKSFIEVFTSDNERKRLLGSGNSSYNNENGSYSNLIGAQNQKHFIRLRNSFEDREFWTTHNYNQMFAFGNSYDFYNDEQRPNLPELCTRFVAVVSITKSISSFCINSYKFGQKVCSMVFEQPIHNLLSNQDYSWLTGIKLVEIVNRFIEERNLPKELFINQKNAFRALNYSFSQKIYNIHQACTQSLVSQKSTMIYRQNISLHVIKPIFKLSCAEFFGISPFLYN
ncbi:hypothetical protein RS030_7929 [Cryptosporidium xiaoi]|uniref:Signal peptide-containing protein n=1 Tax=Cryptosporidium xiaoi TaxID=659607 RepID=A0AAV9XV60_9CRYT